MKNLKELGLNPIDEKSATGIYGGTNPDDPYAFPNPTDVYVCCYNIPPDILLDIVGKIMP